MFIEKSEYLKKVLHEVNARFTFKITSSAANSDFVNHNTNLTVEFNDDNTKLIVTGIESEVSEFKAYFMNYLLVELEEYEI